ncbi:MAG: hypothetical protein DCC58_06225 [Chloroflexi bacterium]|nr:MAG: hypothetical protein DCC58_06225 [Chloroflexota bacterium]
MANLTTHTSRKIDELIDLVLADIDDAAELASTSDMVTEATLVDFSVEWRLTCDRLLQLKEHERQGNFNWAQTLRYMDLQERLDKVHPAIDALLQGRLPSSPPGGVCG